MPNVTFVLPDDSVRTINIPNGWTIMEAARKFAVLGMGAKCGGGGLCGTCHVQVDPQWYSLTGTPDETEAVLLDWLPYRCDTSRLACQIVVSESLAGMLVRVPERQTGSPTRTFRGR